MAVGRFAPSPTGQLHVGNLRTALVAWLLARHPAGSESRFLIRVEDLDPVASRDVLVAEHLDDLAALGLTHDGEIIRQSAPEIRARHDAAIEQLAAAGRLYPCFCTRKEIAEAARAAHGPFPEGAYPGTCRDLTPAEQDARRAARDGRPPAWRVRADGAVVTVTDGLAGAVTQVIDDFVVRRADGVPAYNLAVVVDDHAQGVDQVVRGDDLLDGTPRQVWLARELGAVVPNYVHVPLVLGPDGERLAKRHGATSRTDLAVAGVDVGQLRAMLGFSLGLCAADERVSAAELLHRFTPDAVPTTPWVFDPDQWV